MTDIVIASELSAASSRRMQIPVAEDEDHRALLANSASFPSMIYRGMPIIMGPVGMIRMAASFCMLGAPTSKAVIATPSNATATPAAAQIGPTPAPIRAGSSWSIPLASTRAIIGLLNEPGFMRERLQAPQGRELNYSQNHYEPANTSQFVRRSSRARTPSRIAGSL